MAEGQEATPAAEPSMEEILASIRKIIADDEPPKPVEAEPAEGGDVLELTQMVEEDGSVTDLKPQPEEPAPVVTEPEPEPAVQAAPEPEPLPEPEPTPEPVPEPEPVPVQMAAPVPSMETLVSEAAAHAATSSLAALENVVQVERMASQVGGLGTPLGRGSRTLEEMVAELMRPMLKEWLDKNLSAVVDRLVQKEIERITKRRGD